MFCQCTFYQIDGPYRLLCLVFFLYVLDNTHLKQEQKIQAIIVIETIKKKLIKLLRNSSIEIKVEIVTNILKQRLYKDKTN